MIRLESNKMTRATKSIPESPSNPPAASLSPQGQVVISPEVGTFHWWGFVSGILKGLEIFVFFFFVY